MTPEPLTVAGSIALDPGTVEGKPLLMVVVAAPLSAGAPPGEGFAVLTPAQAGALAEALAAYARAYGGARQPVGFRAP